VSVTVNIITANNVAKVDNNLLKLKVKVTFSQTCYRVLGPELIPVYRQSARR